MREMCRAVAVAAFVALASMARADVAADLKQAAEALAKGDTAAAQATFRKAFEAEAATEAERRQALDGLVTAAIEAGKAAETLAFLRDRAAGTEDAQIRRLLAGQQHRCRKAIDGHLHGVIAQLEAQDPKRNRDANQTLRELQRLCSVFGDLAKRQSKDAQRLALTNTTYAKPSKAPRDRRNRPIEVPAPVLPAYRPDKAHIPTPRRSPRRSSGVRPYVLTPPRPVRYYRAPTPPLRKPTVYRPKPASLAASFLSRFYRRSTELAGQGFYESAKAELATVMQLFPRSAQAEQAAQYAVRLFQRERGVAGRAQANALVAYLEWIRAVVGPDGLETAEYMALKRFAPDSDPAVVAREAEAFIERHPESKYLTAVRLQLGIALDALGDPDRAITMLEAVAKPMDSTYSVQAARLLAWLHLFQGQPERSRATLQALAAQTLSQERAADAKAMLARMEATPPEAVRLPVPDDPEDADLAVAEGLAAVAEHLLAAGDAERAMDLFTLFLRVGKDAPNFWTISQRVKRLRQKGEADGQ